jgi:hypothetical protein
MPRFRAWGLAAAAAVGLAPAAFAGDASKPPTTLFAKWFGPKPKPSSVARGSTPPTVVAPLSPDVLDAALTKEQAALNRRMQICDRFREIAQARNDDELMRLADQRQREALALYKERTAALGVPQIKEPAEPELETRRRDASLAAPAAPTAIGSSVRTAEWREVQP